MIVPWFERMNLWSSYSSLLRAARDDDLLGVDVGDLAVGGREDDVAGVDRGAALHPGADQRRLGLEQRHGLALHVRAHQRAVGVVVLEERDQRRRDRPDLGRRDVHQVDLLGRDRRRPRPRAARQRTRGPLRLLVFGSISAFAWAITCSSSWVASRWTILFGDDAVLDDPVGGRDEAVLGDLRVGGERADQADVRALRGLDRAHPAVVGRVHVADLDRSALAGQAAGAERREAATVREPGERVGLVHELRELRGAEELLQRRDDGADVDDRLRGDRVGVLGGEALADDALHPVEADPEGLLDQLADGAQAAVAEVLVLVEVVVDRARAGRCAPPRRSP